jgi:hypothetical protein
MAERGCAHAVTLARPSWWPDTGRMEPGWAQQVRSALMAHDQDALADLFAAAVQAEGQQAASRSWLEITSAFDAAAETG